MKLTIEQINQIEESIDNINGLEYPEFEGYENDDPIQDITQITANGGYSVDWTDREGRHPWAEFNLTVDLENQTYRVTGECSSEDGRHDESSEREGSFEDVMDLGEIIDGEICDICHEIDA